MEKNPCEIYERNVFMIKLNNYQKIIKGKTVIDSINYTFEDGKAYLLTGHNGCGKTMLLRAVCGLINPTSGDCIRDKSYSFGVIIENPSFMDNETAIYNLRYLAKIRNTIQITEIEEALKKVNLFEYRNSKVKSFSLGMKQRLAICQAIMENPDVLLLDEPFNALDDKNYNDVLELLKTMKNEKRIIIVAAHNVDDVNIYDETLKMENGKLII